MAKGATIDIHVPNSVANNISNAAVALKRFNLQLMRTAQFGAAARVALTGNVAAAKQVTNALTTTASALQNYGINTQIAQKNTSQLSNSMRTAASWTNKMGIGLYVIGGAATSIARPLMALSMIFETYNTMEWQHDAIDRYFDTMRAHFAWLRTQAASALKSIKAGIVSFGGAILSAAKKIPFLGGAIKGLTSAVSALNISLSVAATYLTGGIAAVIMAMQGARKLADNFAPVSEHLQRAISVSALTQDQFSDLTRSVFSLQRQIGVFTTEELASMIERMAYAGAIGEGFKETALAIGQIAKVTGMEMAEITRDMARLTSQTGSEYKELANVILRTFAQASITYEETVESFQQAGMLLREDLGMNIDEMGAVVVQLEKFGYTGTRAATAIRALAARSSELKSGLRGAPEIFQELGVTGAVQDFQKGDMALDELIKTFGRAGASYGEMVNIFNRRAGVAAAAMAEFSDEYEASARRIREGTANVTEMFGELRETYQGQKEALEATKSRAVQRWAFALRRVGEAAMTMNKHFWNMVDLLGVVAYKVPEMFEVWKHALLTRLGVAAKAINMIANKWIWFIEKIMQGVEWMANVAPGFGDELSNEIEGARKKLEGWRDFSSKKINEFILENAEGIKDAWGKLFSEVNLDVVASQRRQQERLKEANEEFGKEIGKATEELKSFGKALHPEFIKKIQKQLVSLTTDLSFASENTKLYLDQIKTSLRDARIMGEKTPFQDAFHQASTQALNLVGKFVQLNEVSGYMESKFEDVREELEELFGMTRTINRRHAAVVRETGRMVGAVQKPEDVQPDESVRSMLNKEQIAFFRTLLDNMGQASSKLPKMIMDIAENYEGDEISSEILFNRLLQEFFPKKFKGPKLTEQEVQMTKNIKDALSFDKPFDKLKKDVKSSIIGLAKSITKHLPDDKEVSQIFDSQSYNMKFETLRNTSEWVIEQLTGKISSGVGAGLAVPFDTEEPVRGLQKHVISKILAGKEVKTSTQLAVLNLIAHTEGGIESGIDVPFDLGPKVSNFVLWLYGGVEAPTNISFDLRPQTNETIEHLTSGIGSAQDVSMAEIKEKAKEYKAHLESGSEAGQKVNMSIPVESATLKYLAHLLYGVESGEDVNISQPIKDALETLANNTNTEIKSGQVKEFGVESTVEGLLSFITNKVEAGKDAKFDLKTVVGKLARTLRGRIREGHDPTFRTSEVVKTLRNHIENAIEGGQIENFDVKEFVKNLRGYLKSKIEAGELKEFDIKSVMQRLRSNTVGPLKRAATVPFDPEKPMKGFIEYYNKQWPKKEDINIHPEAYPNDFFDAWKKQWSTSELDIDVQGKLNTLDQYLDTGLSLPEDDVINVTNAVQNLNKSINKELKNFSPNMSDQEVKNIRSEWNQKIDILADALDIDKEIVRKMRNKVETLTAQMRQLTQTNMSPAVSPWGLNTGIGTGWSSEEWVDFRRSAGTPEEQDKREQNARAQTGGTPLPGVPTTTGPSYQPIESITQQGDKINVTIDQKTEPQFTIELSGVEDTGNIENRIRRAISRAFTELNNEMKSGVDPQAIEQFVQELLREKKNRKPSGGTGGKGSTKEYAR